jgi:H/ACA ribonucleoprotein complex subunit 4
MMKLPYERIKREILIKRETESSHGTEPGKRTIEQLLKTGIINLDKPSIPTSHQTVTYVKKILNIRKAGHSGTLDPKVTGVLPIGLNDGTKILQALLKAGKEYVCLMHLHKKIEPKEITKVLERTVGKIKQLPPIKSHVKREMREREIYYIHLLEIKDQDVLFIVGCEAGTYIRKLVHDIGAKLKIGANMQELRRTRVGPFREDSLVTLQQLTDAYQWYKEGKEEPLRKIVFPLEKSVDHLPKIWINDGAVDSLCHGAKLGIPGIVKLHSNIKKGDLVAVMTLKDELVMLGRAHLSSNFIMKNEHGYAVVIERVIMPVDTYPKFWKRKIE